MLNVLENARKNLNKQSSEYTRILNVLCYVMLCILYLKSIHKIVYNKKTNKYQLIDGNALCPNAVST